MMRNLSLADLGLSFVNDIRGRTDPTNRDEHALVGGIEGTVFVDISDPKRPEVRGILPTRSTAGGDVWRDIKVFDDRAQIVSENDDHGMQVFDLTLLRDVEERTTFTETATYDEFGDELDEAFGVRSPRPPRACGTSATWTPPSSAACTATTRPGSTTTSTPRASACSTRPTPPPAS